MSGYLQRLLDRTAPATQLGADVLPTGLSHSPVSLSDQRLNDPDFADRYAPPADGQESFDGARSEPPRRAPRRAPQRPAAETTTPEPTTTRPEPALQQIVEPSRETPVTEAAWPPLQHPRPAGLVEPSDLVLPEPEPAAERDELAPATAPAPPQPVQPAPTQVQTEPTDPPLAQPRKVSAPTQAPVELAEVTPSPPRPEAEPVRVRVAPTPDLPAPQATPNDSSAPEPRAPVEAMPTPLEISALPDLPLPAPRQPEPTPAPAPVVQAVQEPPKHSPSADTRRIRPMTATAASIIGQLTPRRRALTIFGLRRR